MLRLLLLLPPCVLARYETETRLMRETVDLSEDLVDRFRRNADRLQGAKIGGVIPTFENIVSGKYGISRSLFFYVKNAHLGVIPGIREYVRAFTNEAAWGLEGYLVEKGLIPLSGAERENIRRAVMKFTPLAM